MHRKFFIFWAAMLMLTACATPAASSPKIHLEGAWARPADAGMMDGTSGTSMPDTAGGMNSAVYFVIVNDGNQADVLTGAASDVSTSAELHKTSIQNDVAQMTPISRLEIPAHGRIEFKPSSYHVMLVGLTRNLIEGDLIKITFYFEKSGAIAIDVPIRQQ